MLDHCDLHTRYNAGCNNCIARRRRYGTSRPASPDYSPPSNAGQVSINSDGGVSIGLGGGLAMDPTDGDLGIQVGGFTFDFDGSD